MPRYYRRRPYRRPYSVSFRFGRARRKFNRQLSGALQQRDTGRFVIKLQATGIVQIAQGTSAGVTTMNVFQLLENSGMFINLKTVFDQVKVNAIRVKLVPTALGGNGYLQNVLAWDRNGEQNITWLKAVSYGSAKTNYFMGGGKTTLSHFIAAETIGEKTQYMATQDILNAPNMAWKPMLIFGIAAAANAGAQDNWFCNFAVEFAFDCTFRGTRLQ